MQVLFADIYRDGGSYGVVLELDGRHIALLLQVEPWDNPAARCYGSLFVSDGDSPFAKEKALEIGGAEERYWVEVLRAIVEGVQLLPDDGRVDRLREMAVVLELRCGLARREPLRKC